MSCKDFESHARLHPHGRALRDSDVAAASTGINVYAYKTLAFAISAAFAGVAGVLFVLVTNGFAHPDEFTPTLSIRILIGAAVGGLGSLWGVVAGAAFVYRFNTLDGKLSGFENDHFPQLVRSMAMLDGERPLRDFTDAELRALWPAPTYSSSALAQRVFGRSLRTEALLTIGMLSIGAAALFLVSAQPAWKSDTRSDSLSPSRIGSSR